jgi:hypothetical protein
MEEDLRRKEKRAQDRGARVVEANPLFPALGACWVLPALSMGMPSLK